MTWYQNVIRESNLFLNKAYLLEFYEDLVYKLRKLLVEIVFLINLGKESFLTKESDKT